MKALLVLCVLSAAIFATNAANCKCNCKEKTNENTNEKKWVCGSDGTWYADECDMLCNDASEFVPADGEICACPLPRIAPTICGVDGKRYGTEREMRCIGVEVSKDDSLCGTSGNFFE